MKMFKAWLRARKIKVHPNMSSSEMNDLYQAMKFSSKIRSILKTIWAVIAGVCTIIAAVFSVLAYFKQ